MNRMHDRAHSPTVRDFLYLIFKYKATLLLLSVSALAVALLYPSVVPLKYEAMARILIKAGREDVQQGLNVGKQGPTTITNVNAQEMVNSELELLKGRQLAEEIVDRLQNELLYPPRVQPVTWWQKTKHLLKGVISDVVAGVQGVLVNLGLTKKLTPRESAVLMVQGGLKTELIKNSNTAKISFKSADAELAANIVNSAVEIYLKNRVKLLSTSGSLDFFSQESELFKGRLQESEQRLKFLRESKSLSAVGDQKRHLLNLMAEVRTQLNSNDAELSRLSARVSKIGSLTHLRASATSAEKVNNPSEVIDSLKIRLTDLKLQRLTLLGKHLEGSPLVATVDEEIRSIEHELNRETAVSSVAVDISSLQATRHELNKAYQKLSGELKDLTHYEDELKGLNRDVSRNEELYKIYADKKEEARIFRAMDSAHITNVSVVEPAYAPIIPLRTIPFIPQRIFLILMALVVSALVNVCFVTIMEMFDHSFNSAEDLEGHTALPILGVISENKLHPQTVSYLE